MASADLQVVTADLGVVSADQGVVSAETVAAINICRRAILIANSRPQHGLSYQNNDICMTRAFTETTVTDLPRLFYFEYDNSHSIQTHKNTHPYIPPPPNHLRIHRSLSPVFNIYTTTN